MSITWQNESRIGYEFPYWFKAALRAAAVAPRVLAALRAATRRLNHGHEHLGLDSQKWRARPLQE